MVDKPHILFLLGDDIGWNDFSHNIEANSTIPSPGIEALARAGVELQQHHMHSLCTPSRAALLTGRYHVNTGLIFVLTPGTPAGLPVDIPTLPQLLRERAGYATAMVGKWHLGHSQLQITPTGRGFDSFTGIYMWDTDSYSKQMVEIPWERPLAVDWVKSFANGSFSHYAEPHHATEAIVSEAQLVIDRHASTQSHKPLFLYVPFTAAHSPLQPMPRHTTQCAHIPHLWRRQFCGMVVGFDEGVKNITQHARAVLGENLVVVVTADNGGSPWFGGNNAPLRGGKGTPFEGGTRVPAIITDFTEDQRHLSSPAVQRGKGPGMHRLYHGLMHVSDWMPTLLSLANITVENFPPRMDGRSFLDVLRRVPFVDPKNFSKFTESPRNELLYEFQPRDETMFDEDLMAMRIGPYKLVKGIVRDSSYYFEPRSDRLHFSHPNWITFAAENLIRCAEWFFGSGKFDMARIAFTHQVMQDLLTRGQKTGKEETLRLYDVIADPIETTNLAHEPWAAAIIADIEFRLASIDRSRPPSQKAYLMLDLSKSWKKTLAPGDCRMNPSVRTRDCNFAHPWIPDGEDPWARELVNVADYTHNQLIKVGIELVVILVVSISIICVALSRRVRRCFVGVRRPKQD